MGEEAGSWKVGDAVCALAAGGGYAEYVVAYAGSCLPVPQRLSWIEAAALPETFFTVWENLYRRARLAEGETVLIHGGSSGIGTTAIQLARESGARVFVTVGTEEKRTACEKLGAERAINYREEDFVEIVKALTAEKGVDVILDMVGGDYVQRNIAALAVDGRLMNINYMTGIKVNVDFRPVLMKSLTLGASVLRSRSPEAKAIIASELRARVWPWLESGRIAPVIYRTFSLAEASAAHALMESSQHVGKIVLVVHDAADASPH
jgi:NADPH2:quinone reductase